MRVETFSTFVDFLRCRAQHKWAVVSREPIKSTSLHVLFSTSGVQKGVQRCARCGRERKAWRRGLCGAGGTSGPWRRLSNGKEKWIDSLPTL